MTPAFWDTSALVPLCVHQRPSLAVRRLLKQHPIVVWWATPVEMHSAFQRLLRMEQLTQPEYAAAGSRLDQLRRSWRELQPSEALRTHAERLLVSYPLQAADALQLAAAWVWSSSTPQGCAFISGDAQLLEAARQVGFKTIAA